MAGVPSHHTFFSGAQNFRINNFRVDQSINIRSGAENLISRLNPILGASHTRNRKNSPPDSECYPGTREEPIQQVIVWADSPVIDNSVVRYEPVPHIYWLHGFAGCGKSSVTLEVARTKAKSGRLLASYFFYRGDGDRSAMNRFAVTIASQLVVTIPATAPIIERAVEQYPGLLSGDTPLSMQLEELVFNPFLAVTERDTPHVSVTIPFILVIDGLDECEDKKGVEEFLDFMFKFFEEHPSIPLRVFIASRVEQHIRERLETGHVRLGNLDSHWPRKDIEKYLQGSFDAVVKRSRIIQTHIRARGQWPTQSDMCALVDHVEESFVLASLTFKSIVQPATPDDPLTPMERFPLALEMNGLDSLYTQMLSRSQHLPHFRDIISTITLASRPLPIIGIADTLCITTVEVVCVLLNLQAIIHVPGTDEECGVTLCHTSLRDFLTTESRSEAFFVLPSFHLYLSYYFFSCEFTKDRREIIEAARSSEHWLAFALSNSHDFFGEIERFKACRSLHANRMPHCAFLCTMLFYSFTLCLSQLPDSGSYYLLTECTKQLVLAAECLDPRIQLWLQYHLIYYVKRGQAIVQFTEDRHKILMQHDVQGAINALGCSLPDSVTGHKRILIVPKKVHFAYSSLSVIQIIIALDWIVGRARLYWEEAKIIPCPPLELSILLSWEEGDKISFSF